MKENFTENGVTITALMILENFNGITINTGKDVFSDRLQLSENYTEVAYQTHDTGSMLLLLKTISTPRLTPAARL